MDLEKITPRQAVLEDFEALYKQLKSLKREETSYKEIMCGILEALNQLEKSWVSRVDIGDLKDHNSHYVYFYTQAFEKPVPFDLDYAFRLKSHFKDRLIVVLKGSRKYLPEAVVSVLNNLERARDFVKSIDFDQLRLDQKLQKCLDEMSTFQTFAKLEASKSRRLDLYYNALRSSAQMHFELECLSQIMDDASYLRFKELQKWLTQASMGGNTEMFFDLKERALKAIEEKSKEIVNSVKEIVGKRNFSYDVTSTDMASHWLSLGPNKYRGEGMVHSFDADSKIERQLKLVPFSEIRQDYDAANYQAHFEKLRKDKSEEKGLKLSNLFFEVERCINKTSKNEGPLQTAAQNDFNRGAISQSDFLDAKLWIRRNLVELKKLHVQLFQDIVAMRKKSKKMLLSPELENRLKDHLEEAPQPELPRINIHKYRSSLAQLKDGLNSPTNTLLEKLLNLRNDLQDGLQGLHDIEYLVRLRKSCKSFDAFESLLVKVSEDVENLEELRIQCEKALVKCFRRIKHSHSKPAVVEAVFEVITDDMLSNLRRLNYGDIQAEKFELLFDRALEMNQSDSAYQLDTLLREIHTIPRQDHLLNALAPWKDKLNEREVREKQTWINKNEIELQKLVQRVRNELRERIGNKQTHWSRRNRFEVFGLADYFGPNLRPLLEGMLRSLPKVTSRQDCERLIENIEAIEAKVVEAHKATSPNGSAYREIKRLTGAVSNDLAGALFTDFEKNTKDLEQLIKMSREGLGEAQTFLKRLGVSETDSEYLSVAISLDDLHELQHTYHFEDNIMLSDIKRFVLVYNHKIRLMEGLYEKARQEDPELSGEIMVLFNEKVFQDFKNDYKVKDTLKTEILYADNSILEAETQLLARTLNFVKPDRIEEKSTMEGLLKILSRFGPNADTNKKLRYIWAEIQNSLFNYQPKRFRRTYEKNFNLLLARVEKLIK